MDGAEEITRRFFVSSGDGAELLELGEEVLDEMSRSIEVAVIVTRHRPFGGGRDHRHFARRRQFLDHPLIGIERLIGDQSVGLHIRQEVVGTDQIVRLPAGQEKAGRVSERVDHGVDLGAQSSARAADRLILAGFFWAPALC